ncbi:t-cell leukemia homeobox protein 3 [Trichonephila clavata]|uniref:T-cell leukemia homeobox protein 3 n=1 Tax=Trichonephila clavata TaxID=2740835 RepID=A0A8X6GHQ2_TRICU|nr:t-cell leukemia homeobox protein 3 [Trichonephila clavata]
MLCDRTSRFTDGRSPPVASNAIEVSSPTTRIGGVMERDFMDTIPISTNTGHSASPPTSENNSSSSPVLHTSTNKPKLSFSISRLLGDDSKVDNDNNNNHRKEDSRSSTDNNSGHGGDSKLRQDNSRIFDRSFTHDGDEQQRVLCWIPDTVLFLDC